jgi:hypothetical protein
MKKIKRFFKQLYQCLTGHHIYMILVSPTRALKVCEFCNHITYRFTDEEMEKIRNVNGLREDVKAYRML